LNRFRTILKVLLITLLVPAALAATFHFWLIFHAKSILSEIVNQQSNGRYHLQLKKVKYNYLRLRLELYQPVLKNVDTSKTRDRFELHSELITLQLEKLWPLIFGRKLLIDSIYMDRPLLSLAHQKRNNPLQLTTFSLSEETEKLYQSIQSVLTTLKVANFRIRKGALSVNNSRRKNALPLEIKNIDFYIKGFNIDSSSYSKHPSSYTEEIQLQIAGQTINFPDGNKSIQFSSFKLVANKGELEVDSCSISGGDNDSTKASFNLFAEKMRIKNIYLARNDSTDYNRIDSLFFTKPKVSFSVQVKDAKQDSSETISTSLRRITSAAFGRLLVRYASINNVDFDIEVERKEKLSTFKFVQDSLVISNLGVGIFPSMPISASSIRFGLKEFVDYFRDSTYLVHFDSVRINNDQFSLFNFNIASTWRVKKGQQKIYIPILQIQGIDWYQLISQKKLVASTFTLNDPAISIVGAGESKNKKQKKNNSIDHLLRQTLELKNIIIRNGTVTYAFPEDGNITFKKINTSLQPDLWIPGYLPSIQKTIRELNTGEIIYSKNGWMMTAQNLLYGAGNSISAGNIDLVNDLQNLHIKANNVGITGIKGETKNSLFDIKKLNWENAEIVMNIKQKLPGANNNSLLTLGAISGGPTSLRLNSDNTKVTAKISKIRTSGIIIENGKPTALHDLNTEGTAIDITTGKNIIHSGKFVIRDGKASSLVGVTTNLTLNKMDLAVTVPEVDFEVNVQRSLSNPFDISWLNIIQPTIDVKIREGATSADQKDFKIFPALDIKKILITDPLVAFQNSDGQEPIQLKLGSATIAAGGIKTLEKGNQLAISEVQLQTKEFGLDYTDSIKVFSSNGLVKIALKTFLLYANPFALEGSWKIMEASADLSNITLLNKRRTRQVDSLQLSSLHLDNFTANENSFKHPATYFSSNPLANISNVNLSYKNIKSRIRINGLKGSASRLSFDSFYYRPQISRNAFMAAQSFQKDYITLDTGPASVTGLDIAAWLKDTIFKAGNIRLTKAVLNDTRDKHLPLQTGIIKGLPVTLIKNMALKTQIDSITIIDGRVRYHEISEKTGQTGNLRFTRLKGIIRNIKNYEFHGGDSLYVQASGYLMDTAYIQLRMSETYNDSLASFPITLKAKPFDLRILNPFLLPVMSVKVKSGFADSAQLKAIGREYLSLGEMRFFYHDLKVEFLKDGDEQKKTLLTSLLSFAANSFVIRNKNTKRIGTVYYERSRNRSFFNYLIRMIASGAASSVGAKRNKKYNRLYKKMIEELHLPEIEDLY
jgi:hypothetical protein